MIWSPNRKFCFIHVPKTGGTSIQSAYEPHLRFGDIVLGAWHHGLDEWYTKYLSVGKHSPAIRVMNLLGPVRFKAAYSFAVIRDPLDRMVSYYRWIHSFDHQGEIERRMKQTTKFSDFLQVASKQMLPQSRLVVHPQSGEVIVSQLFRFSDLRQGWAQVCERIGIKAELPHENSSQKLRVEITEADRAAARELFAVDYELFGRIPPLQAAQPGAA